MEQREQVGRSCDAVGVVEHSTRWRRCSSTSPVRARHVRLVVPLKELPLEDELIAVAAAPAGVTVIAKWFPAVLACDAAAHERPGVPHTSRRYQRPTARSTARTEPASIGALCGRACRSRWTATRTSSTSRTRTRVPSLRQHCLGGACCQPPWTRSRLRLSSKTETKGRPHAVAP